MAGYVYGSNPSVKHNAGQLFGHFLNAMPGYSTLGRNITNPNVNYRGVSNPHPSGTVAKSTSSPSTAPTQQNVLGAQSEPDPYAQWGGQTNYDNLMNSLHTQKSNIYGSANDWASNYGIGLGGSIEDYIRNLKQGQQGIDERGVQNELALKQGRSGVLDMVSRGIRSGGVMLANRNAGDSSATGALANAYGDVGSRQLSSIGNQYQLENRNIGIAQDQFGANAQAGSRQIHNTETMDINGAVQNARDSLAALDAWAVDKSLPERIQVEQEKAQIQSQIEDALSKYGGQLDQGVAGVQPTSIEQRRGTAAELANAGKAASNPFDFTSQVPAQFQNTGNFAGSLPLFTIPRKKQQ